MKRFIRLAPALVALAATLPAAQAAESAAQWPSKPVRMVVPYVPGGSTDILTRKLAQQLSTNLNQQFVVDNRAGGGGMVGTEYLARSAPDGYTLGLGNNATHSINQLVSKRKLVDPITDFTPLTLAAMMPLALAVNSGVPANNAAELVAWAKANPGKASFGSAGTATPHHIAGEMLSEVAGGAMTHVPYKGSGQSITDLMGGQIPIVFAALATVLPHAQSGKIKILGLAEAERQKSAPSIPTIGESIPGFVMPRTWLGYFAPPQVPADLADRINAEIVKALRNPDMAATINASGLEVLTSTREEFVKAIREDMVRLAPVVKRANISATD